MGTPQRNVTLEESIKHTINTIQKIKAHLSKAQADRKIPEIRRRLVQYEMTLEDLEGAVLVNVSEEVEDLREECVHETRNEIRLYKTLLDFVGVSDPQNVQSSAPTITPMAPNIQWTPIKFNGDRAQFPAFWESFSEYIDRTTLSQATKVKCLTNCLEGPAKELVEGVAKTGENYAEIKNIIENEYGDVQKLLTTYMSNVKNVPSVTDPLEMRPVLNQLRSAWRNMEVLSRRVEIDRTSFIQQIISKFPRKISRVAIREIRQKHPSLLFSPKELTGALEGIIKDEEFLETAYQQAGRQPTPSTTKDNPVPTTVLVGGSRQGGASSSQPQQRSSERD